VPRSGRAVVLPGIGGGLGGGTRRFASAGWMVRDSAWEEEGVDWWRRQGRGRPKTALEDKSTWAFRARRNWSSLFQSWASFSHINNAFRGLNILA
jgi:hypothetical protein